MARDGFKVAGGIIDAGYVGEIKVMLHNLTEGSACIGPDQKVAQLLIVPIATPTVVPTLVFPTTQRGAKGFGSSGK